MGNTASARGRGRRTHTEIGREGGEEGRRWIPVALMDASRVERLVKQSH